MNNTKLKLTISVDDVNPSTNFRILGTRVEKWLHQLNSEFGVTFNLFIPANYHGKNKLSDNKSWIQELNDISYFACEAHGHFHQTTDPKRFGECEFAEIQDVDEARQRLDLCYNEWVESINSFPNGWRNPGWLCSPESQKAIQYLPLKYVAAHYDHNHGMTWNCKTFFGHDGIQQENISIHNGDMIMYQSHIAGNHNHNVWNEQNYEQLRLSLGHLFEQYKITPKLLKECL